MANTPAPTIVLTRLITDDAHDAFPAGPVCFVCLRRDCEEVEAGRESPPCSLGTEFMAAYEAMVGGKSKSRRQVSFCDPFGRYCGIIGGFLTARAVLEVLVA